MSKEKRTQAERRAQTRDLLLSSARRLFGERGYEATSLEDIARECGLTIRPVYYHFGNKRGLFLAVNELMEQRALQVLARRSSIDAWKSFLALCDDPAFRQIILEDAPNVLGRERWAGAQNLPWSSSLGTDDRKQPAPRKSSGVMRDRAALATLIETAMATLESGEEPSARSDAIDLISRLLPNGISRAERRNGAGLTDPAPVDA